MEKELLKTDRKRRQKHVSVVRKDAHTATARCDRRMKQVYARTNPPSKYAVGEKVYVRLRGKGRLQKKRCVTEAVIEKRNLKRHLYKVSYTSPESRKKREVAGSWWCNEFNLTKREKQTKSGQAFKKNKKKATVLNFLSLWKRKTTGK